MSPDQCLNCGNAVADAYCPRCGQKTSTHRFSLKHIFSHDFIHGVFHVDKGLLYTIRELMVRPGHSIREYLAGKRVRHFNYFTLLLLIITVGVLLQGLTPVTITDLYESIKEDEEVSGFFDKLREYPKLVMVITVPLYALFSWWLFRRAGLNFAEHLVLNAYRAAGEMLLSTTLTVLSVVTHDVSFLSVYLRIMTLVYIIYSITFYWQFFSKVGYTRKGLFFRSFGAVILLYLLITVISTVYFIIRMKS